MKIAVLGGGNGSLAAAGDFALAGHEVRLWRRDRAAVEAHRAAGGVIAVKDFRGRHEARPALITADIAEAVHRAELIVCPTPATAQRDIARALAPHLASGQVVFVPPGTFGSMLFALAQRDAGNSADTIFAETGTLPWLTRKHAPYEAAITILSRDELRIIIRETFAHPANFGKVSFPGSSTSRGGDVRPYMKGSPLRYDDEEESEEFEEEPEEVEELDTTLPEFSTEPELEEELLEEP